jgi:hypothetical protein
MFARYRTKPARGYNALFDRWQGVPSAFSLHSLSGYHRPKLFAYWEVWLRKGAFESRLKVYPNGWTDCNDHWSAIDPQTRKTLARERALLHQPMVNFAEHEFAAAYRGLLAELLRKGARVCMVEFPISAEYRDAILGRAYQATRSWFAAQARQLDVRYMRTADIYAQRPEMFSDMDHLNAIGAKEFSQLIVHECFG